MYTDTVINKLRSIYSSSKGLIFSPSASPEVGSREVISKTSKTPSDVLEPSRLIHKGGNDTTREETTNSIPTYC
jgi:hypothetical protein